MKSNKVGYTNGFINFEGAICVVGLSDDLDEKNQPHALLGIYKNEAWQTWEEDFTIVSLAAGNKNYPKAGVLVGRRGDALYISVKGEISDEIIIGENNFPNQYSGLNEVKRVGNSFYAVGMRRQVYIREISSEKWVSIDKDIIIPIDSNEVSGFLSLDGFSPNEIYCAGYHGEIWKYIANNWSKLDSHTNVILETVTCSSTGMVYIGGDDGTILVGRDNTWRSLHQEITDDHITSSALFQEKVYFATENGVVFCYDDKNFQEVSPTGLIGWLGTTGKLNSNDSKLLSIGLDDILVFDGMSWERIPDPQF